MSDLDEFADAEAERADLKASLVRTQRQLARAKSRIDDLVAATIDAATDAVRAHGLIAGPTAAPPKDRRSKDGPEAALWHLTDWQGSKALADDTPVFTPAGWTTHGALRPGDFVYGPEGKPVEVTAVTGSKPRPCSRVVFDAGVEIVASDEHLWSGYRRYKDGRTNVYGRRSLTWTTAQIATIPTSFSRGRTYIDRAFHLDVAQPLQRDDAELPIDPYLLGAWLGDGNHGDGRIAVGCEDLEHAGQYGRLRKNPSARAHTLCVDGLKTALRLNGFIGNKHVPDAYLYASAEQRLALLQGLMDTDGHCAEDGTAQFTNTRQCLTDAVAWLATSLGIKVHRTEGVGHLYGVPKKPYYAATFRTTLPVFRMQRKLDRLPMSVTDQQHFRFVQRVEPVGMVSAQCITVDGGLYLAGRDLVVTHNCTPSYNSQVMHERVRLFCDKAERITQIQRADHPVRHCAIAFGGDMVEGLFNYPTQPYEIDATLFEQWVTVSALEVEVVKRALALYDTVEVIGEWGNHGRIGSKRDAVVRSDNVDRMTYEFARRLLANEKRLTWHDSPEDIQRIVIGNYRALLIHGDEVGRNGFASPSTIVQHANKWRAGGYRVDGQAWEFRDLYIGHYHQQAEWPMPNGEGSVFQTGSTESDNRYAAIHLASQAQPSQRLHFIDPIRGRVTAQYKVHLSDGR